MILNKGMFDKTFDIEIEGVPQKITLKPLPSKYIAELMTLVSDLQIKSTGMEDKDSELVMEKLADSSITSRVNTLIEATISRSYPEWDKELINDFVATHMFKLLPLIIEVNLRNNESTTK